MIAFFLFGGNTISSKGKQLCGIDTEDINSSVEGKLHVMDGTSTSSKSTKLHDIDTDITLLIKKVIKILAWNQ